MHDKLLTTLGLSNKFLQIRLTQYAKPKTAFFIEDETAQFERMPFGLQEAPGEFRKLMNLVFQELNCQDIVGLYLDEIIILTES